MTVIFQRMPAARPSSGGSLLVDNSAGTLNGSGFGTRSTNVMSLLGLGGAIDTATAGTDQSTGAQFMSLGLANWTLLPPGAAARPYISNEQAWDRGKSLAFDMRPYSAEYKQTLFFDTGVGGFSTMYCNWKHRFHHNTAFPPQDDLSGNYLQHKMCRWYNVEDVVDGTLANGQRGCYMTRRRGAIEDMFMTGFQYPTAAPDTTQYVYQWIEGTGGVTLPPDDTWHTYETWLKMNSSPGAADGYFRVRITHATTGVVVLDRSQTNVIFNGTANDVLLRYWVLQNYIGNWLGGGSENGVSASWWDSIYCQYGNTDDAFKIAYLTDNSVFASSGYKEILPVSSWANTSIGFNVNQGGMANLSGKYIHLFSGLPSAQIGSSSLLQ